MTADWDAYPGASPWRRWGARLLALLAFVAVLAVLYGIYRAATDEDEPEPTAIATELRALSDSAGTLGDRLDALRPRSGAKRVRQASRAADRTLAATRKAGRAFRASDLPDSNAGERIRNGLGAEYEFVTAVIAVLDEPGNRVYDDLPDRAERAREALGALPNDYGLPGAVRGVDRLRRWASAND